MKKFYLFRYQDVNQNSGTGVVAEGCIFDNGIVAMTWLSEFTTLTMFPSIQVVNRLHSHEGKTIIVLEGRKKDEKMFEECREAARIKKMSVERV